MVTVAGAAAVSGLAVTVAEAGGAMQPISRLEQETRLDGAVSAGHRVAG